MHTTCGLQGARAPPWVHRLLLDVWVVLRYPNTPDPQGVAKRHGSKPSPEQPHGDQDRNILPESLEVSSPHATPCSRKKTHLPTNSTIDRAVVLVPDVWQMRSTFCLYNNSHANHTPQEYCLYGLRPPRGCSHNAAHAACLLVSPNPRTLQVGGTYPLCVTWAQHLCADGLDVDEGGAGAADSVSGAGALRCFLLARSEHMSSINPA